MRTSRVVLPWVVVFVLSLSGVSAGQANLAENPSFETLKDDARPVKDAYNADYKDSGVPFTGWQGTLYEGRCEFRVGRVTHSGNTSAMLVGIVSPKMRLFQVHELEPGRYRVTAYLRGLDIGKGTWGWTTEFMFDEKYIQLEKNGTFGWTKLTYVGEVTAKKKVIGPSFGLCAPGCLWVDDVTLEKVADDVALTPKPVLDTEEAPVAPPGKIEAGFVRCPECFYRNMPAWKQCHACGTALDEKKPAFAGPAVKPITSFEDGSPFTMGDASAAGPIVEQHATEGKKALRIERSYASMDRPQNWAGYDWLKADLYTDAQDPMELIVEVRDAGTTDYWTRVNYTTVIPPGKSTLMVPIKQLYKGEKSRPHGPLDAAHVTRLVFGIGDKPQAPLFIDNVRVEVDDAADKVKFDGLYAFDFQPGNTSPVLEGFMPIVPGMDYTEGRGFGLKNAKVLGGGDGMQPEPLYQDYVCIGSGGLAVDVPNGRYRVLVSLDRPALYWGEYQHYSTRTVLAQGKVVLTDTQDEEAFRQKYYHFWNTEDLPTDVTFDKYQEFYFPGKTFDVDVTDGQLFIEFQGGGDACDVSAVIIYPVAKASEGERFVKYVEDRRRFHFDNYFKRVLHRPTGDPVAAGVADKARGFVVFTRDVMKEVHYNDTPFKAEIGAPMRADVFAGELGPLNVAVLPLRDVGKVTVTAGDLKGPGGTIPAGAIDVGYVSYRLSRVTMEGSIYTISPRLVMPTNTVEMPKDITRRFWLTVKTPEDAKPGVYRGVVSVRSEKGGKAEVPVAVRVRAGTLDPVDIPAGPWGYTIAYVDPAKCLRKMREYGFTDFSSGPVVRYSGFRDGKPQLDFSAADKLMATAKEMGFKGVVFYSTLVYGYNAYFMDTAAMKAAGFNDYGEFIKALYTDVQKHADEQGWIPCFINLGDEPIGDDVVRAVQNCEAYRKAFPKGPPYFSFATSYGGGQKGVHYRLSKAVHIPNWNIHDEAGVKLMHEAGCDWAFYNGGNRWTFGDYMYKAVKQFDMKFRIAWHWNCCVGDPYYALDCREDDYAWCTATPGGDLITSLDLFERKREGLGDYRRLLTLARLAKEKAGTPAAAAAEKLIADRMASFKLGQRDHDALFGPDDWNDFRLQVNDAIEELRK
ncbi:MAG TPA: hypothetical protein VMZ92_00995 [Planctomycetota bacterium]|nr:hypothetical protein [Planctomycetota bacterium]